MTSYLIGLAIKFLLLGPPILLALTVHEASHALVAYLRGDSTAKDLGRLSLNPFRHLDVAGTIVFFVTAWVGSGIGWAKPVPVDYRNLKNPQRDILWVSAAGPVSNMLAACLLSLGLTLLVNAGTFRDPSLLVYYLGQLLILGVRINLVLAMFNLLPLPPLDGSGIVTGLLPLKAAMRYQEFQRYGFAILVGLIFLPQVIPSFPNVIAMLVVWPVEWLMATLLPMLEG